MNMKTMSAIRRILLNRKYLNVKRGVFGVRNTSTNKGEDANILSSGYSEIDIPKVTIPELIYSQIEKYYKYTALECAETGRSYTFEELRVKARNFSKALREKLKLGRGDTVSILLPNVPEYPICLLGILEAGLVMTTLNPLYTADEISRQLLDSSAKAIITLPSLYGTAKSAAGLVKKKLPIITIKTRGDESLPQGAIQFSELVDNKIDIPDFELGSSNDVAILPYSSGTTGLPKGVELMHSNIISNVTAMTHPDFNNVIPTTDTHQDISPAVLPMFHIYGLTAVLINMLYYGAKSVSLTKFSPDLYISVLKKFNVSFIFAAPPLVLFLTTHPDVKVEYLKNIRVVTSGAAPLGAMDEQRFIEKAGKDVLMLQGYGLTETSPVVSTTTRKMKAAGSIGKLIPNTLAKLVAVDDPSGEPLGPHQQGELLVKGPQVMKCYHNKPEETKNAFLDGWFRTGDLTHYDENGLLFVTDRLKELIKVRGYQVAPAELEEVLRDFPAVNDAAVIGIPHDTYGEVPRAYIVPKNNKEIKTKELLDYVSEKVAKYKQLLGGVKIVDAIPKNAAGKILRRELKLQYEKECS